MLSALCTTVLLAANPVQEYHTFAIEAAYKEVRPRKNAPASIIKRWTFNVGAITEAIPAEPTTVRIVGHTFTAIGYDGITPEPVIMQYMRFVDDMIYVTISGQDTAARYTVAKSGKVTGNFPPEMIELLRRVQPELEQIVNPTTTREGVQTEKTKQMIEAAQISMELTLTFVGTAIACGGLPYICAGSVLATALRTAWNIVKISDRTDKVAKMEREEEERRRKAQEENEKLHGPVGPLVNDCPPGKSCPGMFETNPAGAYMGMDNDWTSIAFWLDTDGDGEEDTCIITAPKPTHPTPIPE